MNAQEEWNGYFIDFLSANAAGDAINAGLARCFMRAVRREAALERRCEALQREIDRLGKYIDDLWEYYSE